MIRRNTSSITVGAIIIAVVLLFLVYLTTPWWTREVKTVDVTGTMAKRYEDHDKYLIFTDQGVFENTDTLAYVKFDSSDLQAKLMRPGKFEVVYYGFRIPFFSSYPNIVSARRIQ